MDSGIGDGECGRVLIEVKAPRRCSSFIFPAHSLFLIVCSSRLWFQGHVCRFIFCRWMMCEYFISVVFVSFRKLC